jgi:hypothetical protein
MSNSLLYILWNYFIIFIISEYFLYASPVSGKAWSSKADFFPEANTALQ